MVMANEGVENPDFYKKSDCNLLFCKDVNFAFLVILQPQRKIEGQPASGLSLSNDGLGNKCSPLPQGHTDLLVCKTNQRL